MDNSIWEFQKSIEINSSLSHAYNNLGIAYARKGLVKEAIEQFKKAIDIDSQYKDAYLNLGNLYLGLEMFEESFEVYSKGIKLDPNDAIIHNNLAFIYYKKGDFSSAWTHLKKAQSLGLKAHPDFLKELKKRVKEMK